MMLQPSAVGLAVVVVAATVAPLGGWGQETGTLTPEERVSPDSLRALIAAAQHGDVVAQHDLGHAYEDREGVPKNISEAVRWFRAAAEQGLATAQHDLGRSYANGEGVPENDAEAFRWYRAAAEQGHAFAQANLGLMYEFREGVPENYGLPTPGSIWPARRA